MRSDYAIGLLIFIISTFCSCQAQDETRSTIKSTDRSDTSSIPVTQYTDSMFFIEGQLCQHLREIYQDTKGNLWFGTNVYDLMMYNGDSLIYIIEEDGFSGGRVTGFAEDSSGHLWIASSSGLNRYDEGMFTLLNEDDGLENNEIWSILIDADDTIWIGHNAGLSRFDGEIFETIEISNPDISDPNTVYSADRITAIAQDQDGNLWLGTDGYGIIRYDGNQFKHYTMADGLVDNTINDLKVDIDGNLWIGTFFGGVSKYDGTKFHNYTSDGLVNGVEVGGFYEDVNGDIWFAVENNGIYKYDGDKFLHYPKAQFSEGSILSIFRDREDRLWLGGWGGLFRMMDDRFTPVTSDGPWD